MKKILVFLPNWIGDSLMATPFLRSLKENNPHCWVGILIHRRVEEIFISSPFVDEIITFSSHRDLLSNLRITRKISGEEFDTAFLLKPSLTKSLMCKLARIKDIYGYESKKFTFINRKIPLPSQSTHKMDYYLNLIESIGLKVSKKEPDFFLLPQEVERVDSILPSSILNSKLKVILHPKANWTLKMWPKEYFAQLGDKLIEELGASVIITGAKEDLGLALQIEKLMKNKPYLLAGKTNLRELGAVLKRVDLFISADTGIMHLAASVNTPLIAMFGPTHPSITGPRGKGLIRIIYKNKECEVPCFRLSCRNNICMKSISPEEVFREAREILQCLKG